MVGRSGRPGLGGRPRLERLGLGALVPAEELLAGEEELGPDGEAPRGGGRGGGAEEEVSAETQNRTRTYEPR